MVDSGISALDPPRGRASSLGVIVTELVSNACKYAYPEGSAGEVRVRLVRESGDRFELAVEDDGRGMDPDAPPQGTGLGSKLINAMAATLKSAIDYDANHAGVRATLRATA